MAERFAAARAEEELRSELEREKARSSSLARELEVVRSSESFRLGHALVEGVAGRLRWNVTALPRAIYERARGGRVRDAPEWRRSEWGPGDRNVVLFIAWGLAGSRMSECVDRVERLRSILVDMHPLFVVDSAALDPIRRRGYPVEYIVPLSEWRKHRPAHDWGAYVTQRIAAVREKHQPRTVVVFDGSAPASPLDQGVIHSILLPRLATSEDNSLEP